MPVLCGARPPRVLAPAGARASAAGGCLLPGTACGTRVGGGGAAMRRPLPGWKPVLFLLEREGFDSALYHAAQVKALPGRPKSGLLIELADVVAAHRPRRRRNGTGG